MLTENYIIERIEQLCEQKHISRYRLAQRSGIAQSSLSTLLNRKSVPTFQTLEKICERRMYFTASGSADISEFQRRALMTG